jgi:hypothetical protein
MHMDAAISAEEPRALTLSADISDANLAASDASLESGLLKISVGGDLPDSLAANFNLSDGRLSWSEGAGHITGLDGDVKLATLLPVSTKGSQMLQFASIEQGDFVAKAGQVEFSYQGDPKADSPLKLELAADALGGNVRILAEGRMRAPRSLELRVFMKRVELEKVAALFPQFEGRLEGEASGEMALRLEDKRLLLEPGSLQLTPDTVGHFEYTRQGWLTQNPDLDPAVFVIGRDIVNIMEDPQSASVITELALRDLAMTEFTIKVLERDSGDTRVVVQIQGNSMIKGIQVPVVLDVPIRGDVKETINAVLKFKSRM